MKAILSMALAFGLGGIAAAQDKKADPVGTWKCEYDIGGQKRESTLTIKKDGEKLAGTMLFQDKQEAKLTDVNLKDSDLTFTAVREIMDMKLTIKYKVKIDGDSFKGTGGVDIGGETKDFEFAGKREKKK